MANLGYIQVTRECNQNCVFCSNPPSGRTVTLDKAKSFVDDYVKRVYDGVILTGGEPTLFEDLPRLIEYCREKGLAVRMITNGQKIADKDYLFSLKESGLDHLHLSIYSCRKEIQDRLSLNPGSFGNIKKALDNLGEMGGIAVDANTVISKANADHLSETAEWLVESYPFIGHFVWNNLDPLMIKDKEGLALVPKLVDFEVELHRAMDFLEERGKSFRVERVPLCYMPGFEHCSTETRKIAKGEERSVRFLDERDFFRQEDWVYGKADCCKDCKFCDICAGLYEMDKYYSSAELFPVFVDKEIVENRIRKSE